MLLLLLPQLSFASGGLAVGESIDCHAVQDSNFGYILTRTGQDTSSLISYWPKGKDTPEKAIKGTYFETKDSPMLMMASGNIQQAKGYGIYYDIVINNSGKDAEIRDGEGLISLASATYDEKGEIADLLNPVGIGLECGGKKLKKVPVAYCSRKGFGAAVCGVIYR